MCVIICHVEHMSNSFMSSMVDTVSMSFKLIIVTYSL